jgi:inner membrane protein
MTAWLQSGWFWWSLALLLFAIEALAPGVFMIWLGAAAAATAVVLLLVELDLAGQWILFSLLALAAVALARRWRRRHAPAPSDQPLLNRRAEQLVGRVFPLATAIRNGRGKVQVGDALWSVEGEDLEAGREVRVIAVDGLVLKVRPA